MFPKVFVPLADTLNIGNGPAWLAAITRPDLVHAERWAIAADGDAVSDAMKRDGYLDYRLVERVKVKDEPALEIYERRERAGELLSQAATQ
jgi:hypothetical protein